MIRGVVIGKFMPPHKGHEYLFRFAKQYCDELTIIVDCVPNETIPGKLRKSWIENLIPGVTVVALDKVTPQDPSECDDFWGVWKQTIYNAMQGKPDVLIAAMDYGWPLSIALGCEFVQCDIARESVPISATEIRANPMANWDYLVSTAKEHFMKRVCLVGPESTGKSTIAATLAEKLNTVYVPEYAKAVINSQGGSFYEYNVREVVKAQVASENALTQLVNKVMICDTDPLTTLVWSKLLFGRNPDDYDTLMNKPRYDMTYLFTPDTPWIEDSHRKFMEGNDTQEFRQQFFDTMLHYLKRYNRPYTIIGGNSWYERQNHVLHNILGLIGD